nr:transcriptional adapter 2-alpha isoform X1 [Pongo pygmaeus]XP_054312858.1 transcriptional adapter 2-alpha isoform X1 [Pongo pygmaeus]XP_054312859.1 transcriptional adapter 2-alpha isoform X1 [Pongo pygmaeus]XP_054312861.1 transcriptional adapter 2-alpha isoform X1 [Pongo pygmaeus]XP_054312862.1 transcriptional adapter 2-alpha isoform X1 [Pongo pygmaeus]XP_054312863.1 transcriptional adapter 2-alpha isoform X1 [Pongo pygmaeus]
MDRLGSFSNDPSDKPPCRGCSSYLMEPYIKCAECGPPPFFLCLQCFTRGFEYKKHQSDHTYEIMTSDFPVLDPSWTAQEEMALLEAVMDCGFGNWQDVANQMCTKTKEECEKHYMKHFINNPLFASTLLNLKQAEEAKTADTAIPFYSTDDPPRPTFDSLLSRDMAGYMPARADFIEEFDNYAEWDLRDIDFVEDDSDILHALKMAVVDIYHSRLKERQRRKKIIRDHGLINLRKFQLMERRYPKEVQDLYETMRRFARIVGPMEHDKFIESHALEFELRREIKRLQEYRTAGITNFCSARTYDHLKKTREEERLKRTMLSEVLQYIQDSSACQQWLRRQADIDSGLSPSIPMASNSGRRSAPPLNLTGLPGTEKLNEKEKELCQMVRLVPGAYLEYKSALLNECNKQGGLRLAQARALIKIDVNKTRKIYDFLIREGYITKG